MLRGFGKTMIFALVISLTILTASCTRVTIVGQRRDSGVQLHAGPIYVYSFLGMNPSSIRRLRIGIDGFAPLLQNVMREHHFDAVAEGGRHCALRNDFPIDTYEATVSDGPASRRRLSVFPVAQIISSNRKTEKSLGVKYRLILFPANTTVFMSSGENVNGDVAWTLMSVDGDTLVANGTLSYIADIRGFPGKEMAEALVAKLEELKFAAAGPDRT